MSCFGVYEEPPMGYIVQSVALNVKVRMYIASEEAKIAVFDDPTLDVASSPANPCENPHKCYFAGN